MNTKTRKLLIAGGVITAGLFLFSPSASGEYQQFGAGSDILRGGGGSTAPGTNTISPAPAPATPTATQPKIYIESSPMPSPEFSSQPFTKKSGGGSSGGGSSSSKVPAGFSDFVAKKLNDDTPIESIDYSKKATVERATGQVESKKDNVFGTTTYDKKDFSSTGIESVRQSTLNLGGKSVDTLKSSGGTSSGGSSSSSKSQTKKEKSKEKSDKEDKSGVGGFVSKVTSLGSSAYSSIFG